MSDEGPSKYTYLDRETSWLQFGHRVLQEASDSTTPLLERLFFCGIFSSNLDEYFRVRVASLRSLLRLGKTDVARLGISPHRLLHDIHRIVLNQQEQYGAIIGEIFDELATAGFPRDVTQSVSPASKIVGSPLTRASDPAREADLGRAVDPAGDVDPARDVIRYSGSLKVSRPSDRPLLVRVNTRCSNDSLGGG